MYSKGTEDDVDVADKGMGSTPSGRTPKMSFQDVTNCFLEGIFI